MSARRWFGGALLLAVLGMTAASRPSGSGLGQIVARVGGNLAGRVGDTLNVPITVDLTGAPGVRLGGYRLTVRFNPNVLVSEGGSPGTFAQPLVNEDSSGVLRMTAIQPSGADGIVTLGVGLFRVLSDTGSSDITITFEEMSGVAPTFDDLLPILTVVNGTFCHASGKWGDVDGDGQANSRDALVALSQVVGIALDTLRVDTIMVPDSGARYDTLVTLRPGLADVDGDAQVTSRDALIIMSYAVGLPVTGFRIGLAAAGGGACGSGLGLLLAVTPDTLEIQTGQTANAVVSALDAAGHPVSLSGATWTSNNTAVAGVTSPGFGIEARDAGVAVLTARLGASYRASMVVQVVAHRSQWFVDVARSQAALRVGSQAFPFAYIQDAFDAGRDGDTINVAPGTYEESVSSDISVYLRGDPAHPPVLDPRGSFDYYPWSAGLSAGSRVAPMRIDNLRVEHGQIAVNAHGFIAHNLYIEASDSAYPSLYFSSALALPAGAPAGGPRLDSGLPMDTGSIVLDSVTVHGPWGVYGEAIRIDLADTVIIRNSAVSRDSTTFPACNGSGPAGIKVGEASRTEISNSTVFNAPCVGIEVYQSAGSARISGNTVDRAGGAGIAVSLPVVAFDHNLVTRIISGSSEAEAAGMLVFNDGAIHVQSITSVGDVVRSSGDRGFVVWGAQSATIDSLTVDTAGLDGTNAAAGVEFWGGHLTLTHSRISGILGGPGVLAYQTGTVLESRHNVIAHTDYQGLYASQYGPGGPCGGHGCVAPVERGAMSGPTYGPDSLISVGDTVTFAGDAAIGAEFGKSLFVDAAVVDSSYDGVYSDHVGNVLVQSSRFAHLYQTGVSSRYADTVSVLGSAVLGAANGISLDYLQGAARVYGTSVDSTTGLGVYLQAFYRSGVVATVDSSRFTANAYAGIDFRCEGCGTDTAFVRKSTITGNGVGLLGENYGGAFSVVARNNNIVGNPGGGASNSPGTVMDADTNYWGDPNGPQCSGGATGCDSTSVAGDFITSPDITFAGWLSDTVTVAMRAPPNLRPVARPASPVVLAARPPRPSAAARPARPARAVAASHAFALRAAEPQPRPRAPMMSWRKGQLPRSAKVHHPS